MFFDGANGSDENTDQFFGFGVQREYSRVFASHGFAFGNKFQPVLRFFQFL